MHGGYSSLSYVPVCGRPVGSGCNEMLDSAPAYPLSNHTGAPWSVWSVLWRLRLLCLSRSHIPFEVTLSGSGLLYICRFSRCRYDPYVLFGVCDCYVRRRLDILVCGHLVWSCISRDAWKLGVSISVLEFTRC